MDNKEESKNINKFLTLFFDFENKVRDDIQELTALESFGPAQYEIIRKNGSKFSSKKSLLKNNDIETGFNDLLAKSKRNSVEDNLKIPTKKNIETILQYLPYFEDSNINKEINNELNQYIHSEETNNFYKSLYEENIIQKFNWTEWQDEAFTYIKNPDLLKYADIFILIKLFTTIIRKDRFCEGFFEEMINMEFILKMLLRLKEIYALK